MPFNFYIIILVQFFVLFIFAYFSKRKDILTVNNLCISAIIGLSIGFAFDIIVGSIGLYAYIPKMASYPWGLSFMQLPINGVFSFGPAVATALYIMPRSSDAKVITDKTWAVIGAGYFITLILSVALAITATS